MAKPNVLILRAPGTNCDVETAFAFELAGATAERVHVQQLLKNPALLNAFQIMCLPGGFSYGDDIAAGRILADQLRIGLAEVMQRFRDRDTLLLGICNGFQVLMQTGLLLDSDLDRRASLTWNQSNRFEDLWVHLDASGQQNVFLRDANHLYLPIAHAEGQFVTENDSVIASLRKRGQLALRYADPAGSASEATLPYPANPNGSMANVAGLGDASGRVLGLMPHPERFVDACQHPTWTRFESPPKPCGLQIFENAVSYF